MPEPPVPAPAAAGRPRALELRDLCFAYPATLEDDAFAPEYR